MRVDTMRQIDYWVGVPLCFVVTLFLKFVALVFPARSLAPKNVLFIELSEMGSAILVDPAMRKLAKASATLHFVIFAGNAASLRLLGTVPEENVFTIRENSLFSLIQDTWRFLVWCRRRNIDTVIDLELFSRFTALLTGLSGAINRVGYYSFHNEGLYRGELLTHRVAYNPHIHIAKGFVGLVNAALAEKDELPFSKTIVTDEEIVLEKMTYSDDSLELIRDRVRADYPDYSPERLDIVLINPNASDLLPQRRWMPEYFQVLIEMILESYPNVLVLITGAPSERKEADKLVNKVAMSRCINFAGRVKFGELPLLYNISKLMITNDSGPGHFSAITHIQSFIIFGPETPKLYGSLGNSTPIYAGLACSPCVSASNHRKTPCHDNVCLQVIKPQLVFNTIQSTLDLPNASE